MKFSDRKRIRILAIPLKDLITGNEKKTMECIALGFKHVLRIDLVAGDGEEDAQVSNSVPSLSFTLIQ
jgi:hypothetical protein